MGESLKRHWLSHNVEINAGVSTTKFASFEAKHRVALPQDLRDYFLCVNGMATDVVDDGMIRFWMLEELQPLPEGAPAFSKPGYTPISKVGFPQSRKRNARVEFFAPASDFTSVQTLPNYKIVR